MAYKKPKLNQIVYLVYEDEIYKERVKFIGEDYFLYYNGSHECWYENYNISWATTFEKAKAILRYNYDIKKLKLEEMDSFHKWWRIKNDD